MKEDRFFAEAVFGGLFFLACFANQDDADDSGKEIAQKSENICDVTQVEQTTNASVRNAAKQCESLQSQKDNTDFFHDDSSSSVMEVLYHNMEEYVKTNWEF